MRKLSIQNLSKSKLLNYIILFLSGLLASFSLPPLNIFPLIFFLSIPFFCLIKCINSKEAFVIGFLTAFGWFVFSFYWLSNALLSHKHPMMRQQKYEKFNEKRSKR